MKIFGVDPGRQTGLAWWDTDTQIADWAVTDDPLTIPDVAKWYRYPDIVVVEDFVGQGMRNADQKLTTEILGFVRYYFALQEVEVVVRQPQARRHQLDHAKEILEALDDPPSSQERPHATDALAHCLAYERRYG